MSATPGDVNVLAYGREPRGVMYRYVREISVAGAYVLLLLILAVYRPRYFQAQFAASWVAMVVTPHPPFAPMKVMMWEFERSFRSRRRPPARVIACSS